MATALGAGANAAVSAVRLRLLLKPLPLAEPDRVVAVWPGRFMSQVDLRYLRDHARGLLFEVPVTDPATYATLALGVGTLVTLASSAPARRAASVNPSESLRADR